MRTFCLYVVLLSRTHRPIVGQPDFLAHWCSFLWKVCPSLASIAEIKNLHTDCRPVTRGDVAPLIFFAPPWKKW